MIVLHEGEDAAPRGIIASVDETKSTDRHSSCVRRKTREKIQGALRREREIIMRRSCRDHGRAFMCTCQDLDLPVTFCFWTTASSSFATTHPCFSGCSDLHCTHSNGGGRRIARSVSAHSRRIRRRRYAASITLKSVREEAPARGQIRCNVPEARLTSVRSFPFTSH